ncbi:MAG: hypothetical protein HZB23_15885 [Deltaproteobacteria bacterium]|nr:hypothetical protein [Deltaproteobacteria bacterium]
MLSEQWRAIQREAQLSAEQIGYGVTLLGRANHTQIGLYLQAFFGLSIGLERMGKLIFIADHAITHGGCFPNDMNLRQIGHDLSKLLTKCEIISNNCGEYHHYKDRPVDNIHREIETIISLFATTYRYYNLNYIAGSGKNQEDPISLWWDKVVLLICKRHYSKHQQDIDANYGNVLEHILGNNSVIMHTSEEGNPINDWQALMARRGASRVAQKYGRLYTLQIVRWLSSIISELSFRGAYEHKIEALLGLNEPFSIFLNEDKYLRERKTWSIYRK